MAPAGTPNDLVTTLNNLFTKIDVMEEDFRLRVECTSAFKSLRTQYASHPLGRGRE